MQLTFIEDTILRGGTQLWVRDAILFFVDLGVKIRLITPNEGFLDKEFANNNHIELFTYNYNHMTTDKYGSSTVWYNGLKGSDIAICTVHPPRGDNFHCSILAAKIISNHNLKTILVTKTGTIVPSYKREFYLPSDSINSRIISITNHTKEFLINNYNLPKDLIKLIYQGINVDIFSKKDTHVKSMSITYPKSNPNNIVIGCIGTLEERKGQLELILAIKKVDKTYNNIELWFLGETPKSDNDKYFNKLKHTIKSINIPNRVKFYPFTSNPIEFIDCIEILVLPSKRKEGLPNVILEAMSMKKPVIASNIGGIPEVITHQETGLLCNDNNLSDMILLLLEDQKLREKIIEKAYINIIKYHDRRKQFLSFKQYFLSLVHKKNLVE